MIFQIKSQKIVAAFALVGAVASASAAQVTTTGSFTQLTMGGFYSAGNTFINGLKVNGQVVDVCGGDPTCASAINNPAGVTANLNGLSSVEFGYNSAFRPNTFSFTANTADVAGVGASNEFKLGTVTFTNGGFYPLAFLDFTLTTQSSDSALNNQTFNGRIRLDTNSGIDGGPNTTLAEANAGADYFTVESSSGSTFASLGSVRVYDYNACPPGDPSYPSCNTGSVDVIGHINSLHLDRFANPTGGAFLNSSTTSVLSLVPEPETYAMMLAGLGLISAIARRRRAAQPR